MQIPGRGWAAERGSWQLLGGQTGWGLLGLAKRGAGLSEESRQAGGSWSWLRGELGYSRRQGRVGGSCAGWCRGQISGTSHRSQQAGWGDRLGASWWILDR